MNTIASWLLDITPDDLAMELESAYVTKIEGLSCQSSFSCVDQHISLCSNVVQKPRTVSVQCSYECP